MRGEVPLGGGCGASGPLQDPVDDGRAQFGAELPVDGARGCLGQQVLDGGGEGCGPASQGPHLLLALLGEVSPGAIESGAHLPALGEPQVQTGRGEEGTQGGVPRGSRLGDGAGSGASTAQQEIDGDANGLPQAGEDVVVIWPPSHLVPPDGIQRDAGPLRQLPLGQAGLAPGRGQPFTEGGIGWAAAALTLGRFLLPSLYQSVIVLVIRQSRRRRPQGKRCPLIMAVDARLDKARAEGRLIVVVDDDPSVRELCVDELRQAGYRVEAFAGGKEALDALSSGAAGAAVLVVDWKMPDLDGAEVARRARVLDPRLPILMITGNRQEAAPAARRAGVRHIIDKPFQIEEFVAAVAGLAAGS